MEGENLDGRKLPFSGKKEFLSNRVRLHNMRGLAREGEAD